MTFNLRQVFALVAVFCPLAFGMGACAQAENPQKLNFQQVDDTVANRQKYPFLEPDFIALSANKDVQKATKVFVAEPEGKNPENLFFERIVGTPLNCGDHGCDFKGFSKKPTGFVSVINTSSSDTVFLQTCQDKLSLLFGGPGNPPEIGDWVYELNGKANGFEFKTNYHDLKNLPTCEIKN